MRMNGKLPALMCRSDAPLLHAIVRSWSMLGDIALCLAARSNLAIELRRGPIRELYRRKALANARGQMEIVGLAGRGKPLKLHLPYRECLSFNVRIIGSTDLGSNSNDLTDRKSVV